MRPAPQLQLGNYEALLQLATGGMATVYVARQLGAAGFERLVVVKRVHPHLLSNREFYDMFRDEARVAAMLHHTNVVPVTDVVESDGELFLVMEYVDSVALSTLGKAAVDLGQRLPPAVAARVLVDALSGLRTRPTRPSTCAATASRSSTATCRPRTSSSASTARAASSTSASPRRATAWTETKSGSLKGKVRVHVPRAGRRRSPWTAGRISSEAPPAWCSGRP